MNNILDDFEEAKDEKAVQTNWTAIFFYGFVFILYILIKFNILRHISLAHFFDTNVNFYISLYILAAIIIPFELCFIILYLRRKILSKSVRDSFLTSYLYCIMGYGSLIQNFTHNYANIIPTGRAFIILSSIIIISTPFVIVSIMLVHYITANYPRK